MSLPSWSDIFTSLKPYENPQEIDTIKFKKSGDPRFGIVQVLKLLDK